MVFSGRQGSSAETFDDVADEAAVLDAALLECAARGTYPEAKRLLKLGAKADVLIYNDKEKRTRSALGNATHRGHYHLVKLFLEHHADPDVNDDLTWRPLTEAISTDDERMVQLLLEYGADPEAEVGLGDRKCSCAYDTPGGET